MKKTILVIDNDDVAAEMLGRFIKSAERDVLLATSGNEALGLIDRQKVNLIIANKKNGSQLLEKFRELSQNIPIILVSGGVLESEIPTLRQRGFTDVFPKPIVNSAKTLLPAIERVLAEQE